MGQRYSSPVGLGRVRLPNAFLCNSRPKICKSVKSFTHVHIFWAWNSGPLNTAHPIAMPLCRRMHATTVLRLVRSPLHPGEADEDLLERRLADRVVLDVVLGTVLLHGAEQARPRQARRARDLVLHEPVMLVAQLAGGERRAYELHEGACLGLDGTLLLTAAGAQLDDERVTLAELALDVLAATETLEPAVDHHRQPRTQRLALLHAAHR